MNLYGYADGDPINNSDPFGLHSTVMSQEVGSIPVGLFNQRPPDDPCAKYGSSPTIRSMCMQTHGPQSSAENTCTANCLANQWAAKEQELGRQLTDAEKVKYIVVDHVSCYWNCSYSPFQFAADYFTNSGFQGRAPFDQSRFLRVGPDMTAVTPRRR